MLVNDQPVYGKSVTDNNLLRDPREQPHEREQLGDGPCGAEPTHHVIWTVGADNGLVCAAHAKEALRWAFYAMHPYRMECSIGGAMFDHSANVCVVADLPVQGEPHP